MATITPIAYNTGTTITGTADYGNLNVANSAQDYGAFPEGFRFWATPDLDLGYVIAIQVPAGNQPNPLSISASVQFFSTEPSLDDESFINLANYVTNNSQSFTDANVAATWLNSNGYWTSYGFGKRKITWWNVQNSSSYPGTGTTITDLTGNVNGNLIGSVNFTNGSPKYLSCSNGTNYLRMVSGINSLLNPPDTGIEQSVLLWIYPTANGVIFNEENPVGGWHDAQIQLVSGTMKFSVWPYTSIVTSSIATPLNNWYQVGYTYDGSNFRAYVNGQLAGSSVVSRQTPFNNGGGTQVLYNVGKTDTTNLGTSGTGGNFRFGGMELYNYGLSSGAVLTNFNASKSIYGL